MENRINIGELDTLVTLFAPEQSRGAEGEKYSTYREFSQVFAKVDRDVADQLAFDNYDGRDSVSLTIYKVMGMNTRWQVGIGSKRYEVLAIDMISRVSPLCVVSIQSVD